MDTLDQRPSYSSRTARRYDSDPTFIAAPVAVPDDQAKTLRRDKTVSEAEASGIFPRGSVPPSPTSLAPVALDGDGKPDNRYIDTVRTRQRERTLWKKKGDLLAARIAVFAGAFASMTVASLIWVLTNPAVTTTSSANAASVQTQSDVAPAVDLIRDVPTPITDVAATSHTSAKAGERVR
jgi:hypothetical protein